MRKLIASFFLWLQGWKVVGEIPQIKKYVIIAAPIIPLIGIL